MQLRNYLLSRAMGFATSGGVAGAHAPSASADIGPLMRGGGVAALAATETAVGKSLKRAEVACEHTIPTAEHVMRVFDNH